MQKTDGLRPQHVPQPLRGFVKKCESVLVAGSVTVDAVIYALVRFVVRVMVVIRYSEEMHFID